MSTYDKEKTAFSTYLIFYLMPTIVLGIIMVYSKTTVGEEVSSINLNMSRVEIFLYLIAHVLTLSCSLLLYKWVKNIQLSIGGSYIHFEFCDSIHKFFMVLILLQLVNTVLTGNAVVYSSSLGRTVESSVFSQILNALKINGLFPLYYICCRNSKEKKLFWANVILYVIWKLLCGWTGFVLTIFFYEFYLYIKHRAKDRTIANIKNFSFIVVLAMFMAGSWIYKLLYPIKNSIRYGYNFGPITYLDGITKLLSRLTDFPVSLIGIQNNARIAELYQNQGVEDAELRVFFRQLLPRFIMHNKDFRPLANLVKQSIWFTLESGDGTPYSPWVTAMNLFTANKATFFFWVIIMFCCLIICKELIRAFDVGNGDTNILIYILCFGFCNGANLEALYSDSYLGFLILLAFMIFFGIVKIQFHD